MSFPSEVDVAVIGAGAAGVAAGRRLQSAKSNFIVLEARSRVGGRAWTAAASGFPLDLGCGWLHSAERNPWLQIAEIQGCSIDKTPPPWARASHQIGMSDSDRTAFADALQKFRTRVESRGEANPDQPASTLLDPHSAWNNLI